ncbi:aminotransferase class IV family protein [Duganella sp. BJB1802]|uniref:aminotransferase class IV family protein n=1 Tax=Duganella sp. BJB1802 TaxID=2744575 RepID=UPI0028115AB5|nr:aminotransferase class IV family protein [Duganella sp. BJB1802]
MRTLTSQRRDSSPIFILSLTLTALSDSILSAPQWQLEQNMSVQTHPYPTIINGTPVHDSELIPFAFSGFAHFTAMQVRERRVKGIDLHLRRLRDASVELFGAAIPDEQILQSLRRAIDAGPPSMSLTATIYSTHGEFTAAGRGMPPSVLVRTSPPSNGPVGPLRLAVVEHERSLASIKHVGEGAKTYYLHKAVEHGFDDAVFIDRNERLSEATIWNLVLWNGQSVVWPRADILIGTMMGIVQRQLTRMGIEQQSRDIRPSDLAGLSGAAVMNSWTPGVPVTAMGAAPISESHQFMSLLRQAYDAEPALIL